MWQGSKRMTQSNTFTGCVHAYCRCASAGGKLNTMTFQLLCIDGQSLGNHKKIKSARK